MQQVYKTTDGKIFNDKQSAQRHESSLIDNVQNRIDNYLKSYDGKRLIEQHSLSDYGVWEIKGEDPNCDYGGHHHNPHIATVSGTLEQAIHYAVQQRKWMTWGGGGIIIRVEIINLQDNS